MEVDHAECMEFECDVISLTINSAISDGYAEVSMLLCSGLMKTVAKGEFYILVSQTTVFDHKRLSLATLQ